MGRIAQHKGRPLTWRTARLMHSRVRESEQAYGPIDPEEERGSQRNFMT